MLDDALRAELQKPFGELCADASCTRKLVTYNAILTVGDITTYRVIVSGIAPDVCIVDGITMRQPVPDEIRDTINSEPRMVYEVDNPPGTISWQLVHVIRRAVSGIALRHRAKIIVHGEEDLAVIPAVMEAPNGAAVVYGQPQEGMVIIPVSATKQHDARRLFRRILAATPP